MKKYFKKSYLFVFGIFVIGYFISFTFEFNNLSLAPNKIVSTESKREFPLKKENKLNREIASVRKNDDSRPILDWPVKDESLLGANEQRMILKKADEAVLGGIITEDEKETYILSERQIILDQLKEDNEGPADRY